MFQLDRIQCRDWVGSHSSRLRPETNRVDELQVDWQVPLYRFEVDESKEDTQEQNCHPSTGEVPWFGMVLLDLWRGHDCGQALRRWVQPDLERLISPGACFGCLQMKLKTCTRMNLRECMEGFHRVPYHKW